jgi:phosphotransferase system enzyme I (PtsI)
LIIDKIDFNRNIKVGIMIETPSAAVISDFLAEETDFFSIGTNDLIQYTMAADRLNSEVSYLYNVFEPAVLRLIQMTIENGHAKGIPVGLCGEAGSNTKMVELLLGYGIDDISMSPASILKARAKIRGEEPLG